MKKISFAIPGILLMVMMQNCSTVPLTGRQQLNLVPNSNMLSMSFQQYEDFLKSNKISTDRQMTGMVMRVGKNIQNAVESYFTSTGMSAELREYQWEFNLIENAEMNAWCMPGGKVVVYTGLLPVTRDEPGLAVVMGHEIAHAIAKHGNERMSQQLAAQMGGLALSVALAEQPQETQMLWMTVYGVGAQYGAILPYSRLHENEADQLGLIFMAMAGYDPNVAVEFWERMAAQKKNGEIPEFLSTHPSDASRIGKIKSQIPKAMEYYQPSAR
jgi:predicted Zn-dependent protease